MSSFFLCETFMYNANQVNGVHNTVALLLRCMCIRWLLMLSTNLWRSAITWKPMTGSLWLWLPFMALVFTTHTVTCGVFTGSALMEIRGTRDHRVKRLYPNGNFTFQEQQKVNQWCCVMSNKCTESHTSVMKLLFKKNKTIIWDPHFQFTTYPTAGMDVNWSAANCNIDVWYDDCILTIISQIKWHMPIHVTQWCYSDDAALPWWFLCVMSLGIKSIKMAQHLLHTVDCDLWKRFGSLPLSPHPLPYYQSKNSRVYVNWQKLLLNCLWSLHSPQLIVML